MDQIEKDKNQDVWNMFTQSNTKLALKNLSSSSNQSIAVPSDLPTNLGTKLQKTVSQDIRLPKLNNLNVIPETSTPSLSTQNVFKGGFKRPVNPHENVFQSLKRQKTEKNVFGQKDQESEKGGEQRNWEQIGNTYCKSQQYNIFQSSFTQFNNNTQMFQKQDKGTDLNKTDKVVEQKVESKLQPLPMHLNISTKSATRRQFEFGQKQNPNVQSIVSKKKDEWDLVLEKLKSIPDLKPEDLSEFIGYKKEGGKLEITFKAKK